MKKTLFLIPAIWLLQVSTSMLRAQSPTVTINQDAVQADPTSVSSIKFTAIFSQEVSGFTELDIAFTGSTASGNLAASVSGGPTEYSITVSGMSSSGLVVVSIPAGVANAVSGGAPNLASGSTDNSVSFILPSISCPANLTVSTNPGSCVATVNNIDPVFAPSNAAVSYNIASFGGNDIGPGSASGKNFPRGLNTVTYSLPDYPGISCSFTVTVEDHEAPAITCPANITINCAKDLTPPYISSVTATDNCTASELIEITFVGETRSNNLCPDRYTLTRTYKATDLSGNSSTCTQVITIYDTVGPRFNQPPPPDTITVSCPGDVPMVNPDMYTATDECTPEWETDDIMVSFRQVKSDSLCPGKFTLTRTWTATDGCGNSTVYRQVIRIDDKTGPQFNDPVPSPTLMVDCEKDIPAATAVTATDNCAGGTVTVTLQEVRSDVQCTNKFKLTRTWTARDACGNTSSISQEIRVNDTRPPVFDGADPSSVTVSCEKDIPAVVAQTAKDNCGTATVTFSEVKSNIICANRFELTRTWVATDECGNTATRTQRITVYDNESPVLSNISVDTVVLWPPNHKMREITVNYTATDNCGVTGSLSVSSNEPVHGGSDGDQAPDWEVIDDHHIRLRAEKANNGQARYYTVRITVTDGCNNSVVDSVTVVVAHNITGPHTGKPFKVGSIVPFSGVFWDKPGNTHTAKWLLDGTAAANGPVTEPSGNQNGKVTGSYKFKSAGVYKLQMNVTDQNGGLSYANTNEDLDAIVVIYDPNGGNAYGGGWFPSPPGALTENPGAEGKASYGFAVNYGNAAKPKGETQFEFKVGAFEFNALNFDYLAISGARAQFRGTGKIIGGQSGIGFIMTVMDGALDGSGTDKIRMKIYNRNTGYVYYDNQAGAGEAEDPITLVGTNSTVVIQGAAPGSTMITSAMAPEKESRPEAEKSVDGLELVAFPNPSRQFFTIAIKSKDQATGISMQVVDQYGRQLEKRTAIVPGSVLSLGKNYLPGVYYIRVMQGGRHREMKLVKY